MKHLQRFFSNDASGGIILIIAAVLAMLMANLGVTSGLYHAFLETPVQLRVGALEINKNMLLWINDAPVVAYSDNWLSLYTGIIHIFSSLYIGLFVPAKV